MAHRPPTRPETLHGLLRDILLIIIFACALAQAGPTLHDVSASRFDDLLDLKNDHESPHQKRRHVVAEEPHCGYASCPGVKSDKLNVHIIAHTHDDVGWLKTVDQYYYGTRKEYSPAAVQFILDSLVPELIMDKEKRFIYVEMSFFSKWWAEQDEDMKRAVRMLVNEGRLEFINGGWCMNDEATVTYHSTIEQMTLGLKFLNESFGACGHPKVGWQIDPFGHSSEQASLFAQFGFDGMFFTRIGYQDKKERTESKSLDLMWHGDKALAGSSGSIFTNVFRDGYDAPDGYCFDALCKDDMIVDNRKSHEYNLEQRGQFMINFIRRYASAKLTNHLLIPFGGDFQFTAAGQNFKSLDKLIKYIRQQAPDIHIFYSTPSCYQFAVHERFHEKNISLPEKYDDFMPYDSSPTVWWSGYFTSRPSVKLVERETTDLLQVVRQVSLFGLLNQAASNSSIRKARTKTNISLNEMQSHDEDCLQQLWEIHGDLQHHDAVTGTEKQHVTNDYIRRAHEASTQCAKFIGTQRRRRLHELIDKTGSNYQNLITSGRRFSLDPIFLEETSFCSLNISQCEPLETPINSCHYSNQFNKQQQNLLPCSKSTPMFRLTSQKRQNSLSVKELERRGGLVTVYNPLARPIKQVDIRLPCVGRCDLDKVQVVRVATNETIRPTRLSLPAGIHEMSFRNSLTNYEMLFYADLPALSASSFVVTDSNEVDVVDDEYKSNERARREAGELPARNGMDEGHDEVERLTSAGAGSTIDLVSIPSGFSAASPERRRSKRDSDQSEGDIGSDRVIVKFDMQAGMIVGLRRVSDGSYLNVTQKFGTYSPSDHGHSPGAYIFRPNSSEPDLMHKPITFKMVKRYNGSLIEIHQKWADWVWQTIRVDAKKNYIEFDYVVGPVPIKSESGHEVVTRYITNLQNGGVFYTDSNGRQLLPRTKLDSQTPQQLGGSFFPVASTVMIRSAKAEGRPAARFAEAVAVLVDRSQAATSLNPGDLEFLIHRRLLHDDNFGVGEALDEPGEDWRGLITRGKHRLFLKFPSNKDQKEEGRQLQYSSNQSPPKLFKLPRRPLANLTYELERSAAPAGINKSQALMDDSLNDQFIIHDQSLNDLRQESIKYALRPIITFDRLRTTAAEFMRMLNDNHRLDYSLLNNSLPKNIHLLTLQPWNRRPNELLIRLENLDNPLVLSSFPNRSVFKTVLASYREAPEQDYPDRRKNDPCSTDQAQLETTVDIEYMLDRIRIFSLEEYNLGVNVVLSQDKRLNWSQNSDELSSGKCDVTGARPTVVRLRPRQIVTFIATFGLL